jgi:putative addiction module component (TIGR02574 family)
MNPRRRLCGSWRRYGTISLDFDLNRIVIRPISEATAAELVIGLVDVLPGGSYNRLPMSNAVKKLFEEASSLPEGDRAELVELLTATLPFAFDPKSEGAWHEEIRRRGQEIEDGSVRTVPWEEVDSEIDRILNEKKR